MNLEGEVRREEGGVDIGGGGEEGGGGIRGDEGGETLRH